MPLRQLSIQWKITMLAGLCLAGIVTLLVGLSLVFEPNALDTKDSLFAGKAELGSNETGRFALYWSQPRAGQLTAMALPEHDMANTEIGPSGQPANTWWVLSLIHI